jgi:glyoxylase-like metal-dependent hydrolase (beta-lactamase superfamily II)
VYPSAFRFSTVGENTRSIVRRAHPLSPFQVASFERYFTPGLKGNCVTYFGHSTFSLTTPSGQVALIDPWVTTNPAARKKLDRLDAIFLTHARSDHPGDLLALAQ